MGGREKFWRTGPRCRESKKQSPRSETWPIMCARERAFLRGGPRLAEGGRRRHVDESRAAGKPRAISLDSARDFEKKGARDEKEREREREATPGTLACFRLSLYILLPTYTCLRVSPRCSGLNILAVRRAPLSSLSSSLFLRSPLVCPLLFFVYVVASAVRETNS